MTTPKLDDLWFVMVRATGDVQPGRKYNGYWKVLGYALSLRDDEVQPVCIIEQPEVTRNGKH